MLESIKSPQIDAAFCPSVGQFFSMLQDIQSTRHHLFGSLDSVILIPRTKNKRKSSPDDLVLSLLGSINTAKVGSQ